MEVGTRIWVSDSKDGWATATLTAKNGKEVKVIIQGSGEEVTKKAEECYSCMGAEPGSLSIISDLTRLPALHEPALLQALQERYETDQIYTSVGPILIAVNPFKRIKGLYESTAKWISQQKSLPPHVYGLADASFKSMIDHKGCNQSILVSGESGAGKTETTKHAMQYLTEVSGEADAADVSARILSANPLLEAFGNAKTVRNDNSSRFGKLIEMKFANSGRHKLIGAGVTSYLLEKGRIVHQARGERNYHIFYELFAAATQQQKTRWKLSSPQDFRYTNASGEYARADVADNEQFEKTLKAMTTLGFTAQDCDQVFQIVAAVLHLGNVDFEDRQGGEACAVINEQSLKAAADLLCIEAGKSTDKSLTNPEKTLADVLCVRRITVQGMGDTQGQGETYVKTLNKQFAREARDALAMAVYERLFSWIVWRVNYSMEWDGSSPSSGDESHFAKGPEKLRHQFRIGVLDIFGFEVFEDNYFEQLCINYANEQLQRQFNEHVFELEQKMYESEGVDWTFVTFPDNSATITMIESKPIGLLSLIDEECMYPSGGDKTLASKLYQNLHGKSDRFHAPHNQQRDYLFTVKHFAGDVTYTVEGFYRKNKNELRQDAVDLICSSSNFLLRTLLPPDAQEAAGGADAATYFEKRGKQIGAEVLAQPGSSKAKEWESKPLPAMEKPSAQELTHARSRSSAGRRSQLQQTTVSSHFKTQLHSALTLIRASKPHYVRCLKPNDKNRPNIYTRPRVLNQLRYSGVVEVIKVARAGYPTRFDVPDFVERYAILITVKGSKQTNAGLLEAQRIVQSGNVKLIHDTAQGISTSAGLQQNVDFQVGKTKVFLRAEAMAKLEMAKVNKVKGAVRLIQKTWRHFYKTHRYGRAARKVQRAFRGFVARKKTTSTLVKRRAAADFIHSSPNLRRWVLQIHENVKLKLQVEAEEYDAMAKGEQGVESRLLWWYVLPLAILAGVPRFLKKLYYNNPNVLLLLFLSLTGAAIGSILMLDAQRRGILPKSGTVAANSRRRSSIAMKKEDAMAKKRRKASAVLFGEKKQAATHRTSSVTSTTRKDSAASRKSSAASPRLRFGGGIAAPIPKQIPVQINVNADAVKRFAGLAIKRKEAMDRAKRKAEDMLRSGELHAGMTKRGSGRFESTNTLSTVTVVSADDPNDSDEPFVLGSSYSRRPSVTPPNTVAGRSSALRTTPPLLTPTSASSVSSRGSTLSFASPSDDITMNKRTSALGLPQANGVNSSQRTSALGAGTASRTSNLASMVRRFSGVPTSANTAASKNAASSPTIKPTLPPNKPMNGKPVVVSTIQPLPSAPAVPSARRVSVENQERTPRKSSGLDDTEQYLLNKAILTMFLEEQAPDRTDMADDLLEEFKGKEESLFDKLTNEFPDADALQAAESTDTPAWNKFAQRRKQRQSHRGFFGTASPSLGLEEDVRVVSEKTTSGAKKNRFSVSKKRSDVATRSIFGKLTGLGS